MNFGEHLKKFLRNKGTAINLYKEQGNMLASPPEKSAVKAADIQLEKDLKLICVGKFI